MRTAFMFGSAAAMVMCAGQALAQPTVDGTRDAIYGNPLWVNTITTGFGDASASAPCDASGLGGDPAAVQTGMEFSIPLSSIGLSSVGSIGMSVVLTSSGYNFVSNQFLPGLPNGTGNLGTASAVNLGAFAGNQHVFFTPAVVGAAPVIDGTRDASYGAPIALQTARTGFGNSLNGNAALSNGSELNGLYAVVFNNRLYVMITGNQEQNFNKISVLFDTIAGGQNTMATDNPDVDFNGLNQLGGLTFDTGFAPDYWIAWGSGNGGGAGEYYPNYARLRPSPSDPGNATFLYCDVPGNGPVTTCGDNSIGMESDINHSNIAGVEGTCPPVAGTEFIANGSELNALYAYVDPCAERLYIMLTGNLQNQSGSACSEGGNKVLLFLDGDGATEGQNTLRADNLDVGFSILRNMGPGGTDAGLTFDAGFFADYFMLVKMYQDVASQNMDVSVLRANGPTVNGVPVDYGAFDGGNMALPAYNPVTFSGNNPCDPTAGFDPDPFNNDNVNRFTSFAPRAVYNDLLAQAGLPGATFPIQPVGTPGLITFDVNNSNVGGVQGTGGSVSDAANVATGFEISIALDEIGWDGSSPIKITAMITGGNGTFLSNQVVGLQGQQNNISSSVGDGGRGLATRAVNFGNETDFPGSQFVTIEVPAVEPGQCDAPTCPACPADFDQDGGVTGADVEAFFLAFEAGDACGDTDLDGGVTGADVEAFFVAFENGGC
jgi:hypothetical protein